MKLVNPINANIYETFNPFNDLFIKDENSQLVADHTKINLICSRYNFVLINCSTEHWGSQRSYPLSLRMCELLEQHGCRNFLCLCSDPSDESLHEKIMYFPFFGTGWNCRQHAIHAHTLSKKRLYFLSNLGRFARDFRIANYLMLMKKPYADRCLVRLYDMVQPHHGYDGHFDLTDQENRDWNSIKENLPTSVTDGYPLVWQFSHPAFRDSYVHLVSESTVKDKIFITEKTWQPVAAGQLFLVWGNYGIISHLRELGVDVFDDLINHSYDTEKDHRQRLILLHKEIDRLAAEDLDSLYQQTLARRSKNSQRFFQRDFVKPFVDRLNLITKTYQ